MEGMRGMRPGQFGQKIVIKDLDLRMDWFHEIIHFLHNIPIWSYADRKT